MGFAHHTATPRFTQYFVRSLKKLTETPNLHQKSCILFDYPKIDDKEEFYQSLWKMALKGHCKQHPTQRDILINAESFYQSPLMEKIIEVSNQIQSSLDANQRSFIYQEHETLDDLVLLLLLKSYGFFVQDLQNGGHRVSWMIE